MKLMHTVWARTEARKPLEEILLDTGFEHLRSKNAFIDVNGDYGYARIEIHQKQSAFAVQVYANRQGDADYLLEAVRGKCAKYGIGLRNYAGEAA